MPDGTFFSERAIQVELVDGRLPNADELGAISTHLVKASTDERKFVAFYLPGMRAGEGAFATAHHLPKLEVKILEELLPEKYKKLLKK